MAYNKLYLNKKRKIIIQYLYRTQYKNFEIFYLLLKMLISNTYISKQVKVLGIFYLIFLIQNNSRTRQRNICLFSGQSRSVNTRLGMRRNFIREQISYIKLPGYSPAR